MANSTASSLITATLDNLSRSGSGTTRSGVTLANKGMEWLNAVMRDISYKHDFKEMKKIYSSATFANQKTYAFPTNWKTIVSLRLIDGFNSRKLVVIPRRKFDEDMAYPENETTGLPTWYIPYGNNFDLFKIPDVVYTMYCQTVLWPTAITVVTSTIDYEPIRDDMIIAGMTARGFEHIQMYEDATHWKREFSRFFREAELQDITTPDWSPRGEGFDTRRESVLYGAFWNDPFVNAKFNV